MKIVEYFLKNRSITILLLSLVFFGGIFAYLKMGKLEDAPFTIKQALVVTQYPGASPKEVQTQVTDVLEESIQSMGELYYLKTENRAGISKITVFVKKEIRTETTSHVFQPGNGNEVRLLNPELHEEYIRSESYFAAR